MYLATYRAILRPFVCDSGFFCEMNVESLAVFLEKLVYEFYACRKLCR